MNLVNVTMARWLNMKWYYDIVGHFWHAKEKMLEENSLEGMKLFV